VLSPSAVPVYAKQKNVTPQIAAKVQLVVMRGLGLHRR